jgi:hypothetical protein
MKKYKFMVKTHIAVTANQIIVAANDEDALKQFRQYKGTDLNWIEDTISFNFPTKTTYEVIEE